MGAITMVDVAVQLTVLCIKIVVVITAVTVSLAAIIIAIPYATLWPVPAGIEWMDAVCSRMWSVTKFALGWVEFACTVCDTPA